MSKETVTVQLDRVQFYIILIALQDQRAYLEQHNKTQSAEHITNVIEHITKQQLNK